MTNAQKWVAGFLLLFLTLFFLNQITKDRNDNNDAGYMSSSASVEKTGKELFVSVGCSDCHGTDLKGTKMAPSLYSAKDYWSRDNLINYLRNPLSYSGDERFENYKKQYPNKIMPSFSQVDVKDLGKIADYILSLK